MSYSVLSSLTFLVNCDIKLVTLNSCNVTFFLCFIKNKKILIGNVKSNFIAAIFDIPCSLLLNLFLYHHLTPNHHKIYDYSHSIYRFIKHSTLLVFLLRINSNVNAFFSPMHRKGDQLRWNKNSLKKKPFVIVAETSH